MPQIDPNGALVESSPWIAGQSDHCASLPDPKQIGVPDFAAGAAGQDKPEWLERLLPQNIARSSSGAINEVHE